MKLNAMQMETLRKHMSAKQFEDYMQAVDVGVLDTLTIVDRHGFIHEIAEDGRLVPLKHNLYEDLKLKQITNNEFITAVEEQERIDGLIDVREVK
jgi:hypothetical protein